MARKLNLKTETKADGSIIVSWLDPIKVDAHPRLRNLHRLIFGVWFLVGAYLLYLVYFTDSLWRYFYFHLTLDWITPYLQFVAWGFLIVGLVLANIFANVRLSMRNMVKMDRDNLTHRKFSAPTASITRFEYGTMEQLTHAKEIGLDRKASYNPFIVRLWVDDASAYEISKNNWQSQVNHEIRDALAKALDRVRQDHAQQNHEATHGKTGDFGMPDL